MMTMAERWRVGTKIGKNLYRVTDDHPEGADIGRMDTPELGRLVAEAVTHWLSAEHRWEYGVEVTQEDGTVVLYWRHTRREAEELLAENANPTYTRRLVRWLITTGPAEEVREDA